jgi:hypothetical protein
VTIKPPRNLQEGDCDVPLLNTDLSDPHTMLSDDDVDQEDLCSASRDGDVALVSQLLDDHPFDADDATAALSEAELDPTIIRMLLQHGADVNVVPLRTIPLSDAPGELMRLLANHKYDFKPDGHRILQSVFITTSCLQLKDQLAPETSLMTAKHSIGYLTMVQTSTAQIVNGSTTASILPQVRRTIPCTYSTT